MTPSIVVADTGPINYLVLIGAIKVLPKLFGQLIVPREVFAELCHPDTPAAVRKWMTEMPAWFSVQDVAFGRVDPLTADLDMGEQAAIALAATIRGVLLLMDDRAGECPKFCVSATLGHGLLSAS